MAYTAITGYTGSISLSPTAGSGLYMKVQSFTINQNSDEINVTGFDSSGVKDYVPGCLDFSFTATGFVCNDSGSSPLFLTTDVTGTGYFVFDTGCSISGFIMVTSVSAVRNVCNTGDVTVNGRFISGMPTITWN